MTQNEVLAVFQQIQFFNKHFHASENQLNSNDFRELMRTSKDRCQSVYMVCLMVRRVIFLYIHYNRVYLMSC